jgi:hypothetical protein
MREKAGDLVFKNIRRIPLSTFTSFPFPDCPKTHGDLPLAKDVYRKFMPQQGRKKDGKTGLIGITLNQYQGMEEAKAILPEEGVRNSSIEKTGEKRSK